MFIKSRGIDMDTIRGKFESYKDSELIRIVNIDYNEYTEEAINIAKGILIERGSKDKIVSKEHRIISDTQQKNITLKELLLQVEFKKVFKILKTEFRVDKNEYDRYNNVFSNLLNTPCYNISNDQTTINIEEAVFRGIDISDQCYIEYVEWDNCLSYFVNNEQVNDVGKEFFVAYCLFCILMEDTDKEQMEIVNESNENEVKIHPWKRFFARTIDYLLLSIVITLINCLLSSKIKTSYTFMEQRIYTIFLIWSIIEGILVAKTGTTPGKWLLGITVINDSGMFLSMKRSFLRSFLVCFLGQGIGIEFLILVTQVFAYITLKIKGKSIWDIVVMSTLVYEKTSNIKKLVTCLLLIGVPIIDFLLFYYVQN